MRVIRFSAVLLAWLLLFSPLLMAAERSTSEVLLEGKKLEKAGKAAEAAELYRQALKANPSESLYSACASILGKLAKLDEATALLEDGLQKFPQSPSLLNIRGLVFFRRGQAGKAAADWKAVLAKEPKNSFARDWLKKVEKPATKATENTPGQATPAATISTTASTPEPTPKTGERGAFADAPLSIKPVAQPGTKEDQTKKAKALMVQMSTMSDNDLEALETIHLQVIQECPDTDFAKEAIYMLSNMYQFAAADPMTEKQATLLDYLLAKYPGSDAAVLLMNRIVNTYRAAGKPEKLVEVYSKALTGKEVDDRSFIIYGLDYAKALQETGKKDEARNMLTAVIARDGTNNSFEANVAKNLLTQWK